MKPSHKSRARNTSRKSRAKKGSARIPFKTERSLVLGYLEAKGGRPSAKQLLSRKEFDVTNGRADVVHVSLRKDWRKNISLGKVHPRWAYSLRQMPYRRLFSTADFERLAGTTRKTALLIIRRFVRNGFCVPSTKRDHWIKRKQPKPLIREIVSIEAKLGDWKRALAQAYRHLDYAHRSWVLLDASRAAPARKNLDAFARLNIGLMTLRVGGHPKVWVAPLRKNPKSQLKFWHANAELGRRLFFQVSRVVSID